MSLGIAYENLWKRVLRLLIRSLFFYLSVCLFIYSFPFLSPCLVLPASTSEIVGIVFFL